MTNEFTPIFSKTLPKISNISVIPKIKKNCEIPSIILPPIFKTSDKKKYKNKDTFSTRLNDITKLKINNIYDARKIFEHVIDSSLNADDKLKHIKCAYEEYINLLENECLDMLQFNEAINTKNLSLPIDANLTSNSNSLSYNEDGKYTYLFEGHHISEKNLSDQMNWFFKDNQNLNLNIENTKLKGINLLAENTRLRSELKASLKPLKTNNIEYKNQTESNIEMVNKLKQNIALKLQQIADTKRDIKENYVSKIYIKHLKDNLAEIMTECEEDKSTIHLLEESIRCQTAELKDIFKLINITDEENKSIWDTINNKLNDKDIPKLQAKTNIANNCNVLELESEDESYKWNWYIS